MQVCLYLILLGCLCLILRPQGTVHAGTTPRALIIQAKGLEALVSVTRLGGAAPAQVRAMAEAFSALPAHVLWKLTPGEAEALGNASLASNVKVCMHVCLLNGVVAVCFQRDATHELAQLMRLLYLREACVCGWLTDVCVWLTGVCVLRVGRIVSACSTWVKHMCACSPTAYLQTRTW